MPRKAKKAKKEISRAAIDELIREHKGKHAVECDCLKSCLDKKYTRYVFVGLDDGVLFLNLEKMDGHMLPNTSMTAKKWRMRQARTAKLAEAKFVKAKAMN
jgi:hypothetical protein